MTRYDTSRVDAAKRAYERALAKVEKQLTQLAGALESGHAPAVEKAEAHLAGAHEAVAVAEAELAAARAAEPVEWVAPTESVQARAGHAAGTGSGAASP